VIILSRDAINHNSSVVVCVPCTDLANCGKVYASQRLLKKGSGGLVCDSVAMCEQVRAISINRLKPPKLGHLDRPSINELEAALKITFDICAD
jgi:mRNA-degrading endonuclease toxin of MazEF toxin-antitoxin module